MNFKKITTSSLAILLLLSGCQYINKKTDVTSKELTKETTKQTTPINTTSIESKITSIPTNSRVINMGANSNSNELLNSSEKSLTGTEYQYKIDFKGDTNGVKYIVNRTIANEVRKIYEGNDGLFKLKEEVPGLYTYNAQVLDTQGKPISTQSFAVYFETGNNSKISKTMPLSEPKSVSTFLTPLERVFIYSDKNENSTVVRKVIPGQICTALSSRDSEGWIKLSVLGFEGYTRSKKLYTASLFESQGKTNRYNDYKEVVSTKKMLEIIGKLAYKDEARIASTKGEREAADYIVSEMDKLGYKSSRLPFDMVEGNGLKRPDSTPTAYNIVSKLPNYDKNKKDIYFVGHYDSIGIPGANDNASACAMNIEVARYLSTRKDLNFNPVIFFPSCEEIKSTGSWSYVGKQISKEDLGRIALMINSDMIARQDIYEIWAAVESNFNTEHQKRAKDISLNLGLKTAQILGYYTDHVPFETHGVPSVSFLNINDIQYHTDEDVVANCREDVLMNFGNIILNLVEIENLKLKK